MEKPAWTFIAQRLDPVSATSIRAGNGMTVQGDAPSPARPQPIWSA